jgi:hypothetical protein
VALVGRGSIVDKVLNFESTEENFFSYVHRSN